MRDSHIIRILMSFKNEYFVTGETWDSFISSKDLSEERFLDSEWTGEVVCNTLHRCV